MYVERPPSPATRLDVQRHYLEDKRAESEVMNLHLREERENPLGHVLQAVRAFVVATIAVRRQEALQPTYGLQEPEPGTVEPAGPI